MLVVSRVKITLIVAHLDRGGILPDEIDTALEVALIIIESSLVVDQSSLRLIELRPDRCADRSGRADRLS
jgi:hypothetical protein